MAIFPPPSVGVPGAGGAFTGCQCEHKSCFPHAFASFRTFLLPSWRKYGLYRRRFPYPDPRGLRSAAAAPRSSSVTSCPSWAAGCAFWIATRRRIPGLEVRNTIFSKHGLHRLFRPAPGAYSPADGVEGVGGAQDWRRLEDPPHGIRKVATRFLSPGNGV
jgi:hypothetical protein